VLPCGCCATIMTTHRPAQGKFPEYRADAADLADWYKAVAKRQTRKRKPLALTVVTVRGRPEVKWGCAVCQPSQPLLKESTP